MQSLLLNISHQTMPYSSYFKVSEGHLLKSIWGIGKIYGVWTQVPQIKVRESYIESHCRCLTQLLMLNETSVRSSEGRLTIPYYLLYLGIGASQGKKNQIKGMDTQKFIHSVKLQILHQMKPYSKVKTN